MLTERLTEHLRLTKSARQSLSAVAGQEREWNRMLGQRGCELVDGMAGEVHIKERGVALFMCNELPRSLDRSGRADHVTAGGREARLEIH
jgi:hypothetical protein